MLYRDTEVTCSRVSNVAFVSLSPTSSGGFAAVVYTDTLHAVVMVLGSILLMGFGKSVLEDWAP